MIVDNWFLSMSMITLSSLKILMFSEAHIKEVFISVKKGLLVEVILGVFSMLLMVVCLALYKRIFKETIQDTCHRWFGAKRNRSSLDIQNDLEELQKEIVELKIGKIKYKESKNKASRNNSKPKNKRY